MKNILIVALSPNWVGISRLPKALKEVGFKVITFSHSNSFLAQSLYIDHNYTYTNSWHIARRFKKISADHRIDFIIPGCDRTVSYFRSLFESEGKQLVNMRKFKEILRNSSNNTSAFHVLGNKTKLQELAVKHGLLHPNNKHYLSSKEILKDIVARNFPLVIKKDFGAAGSGVRICHDKHEAELALETFDKKHDQRSMKQRIVSRIRQLLALPYTSNIHQSVAVQDYIEGTPCMHLLFASKGKVLSAVTMLKINCYPGKTGPSSVVKAFRDEKISAGCAKIIQDCNVTGFYSFDFIINHHGEAFILECNPRPTPVTHLSHLCGGNLVHMLKKHLNDGEVADNPYPEIVHEYIALYPNEVKRNPKSEYLQSAFHDVPLDDKLLLEKIKDDIKKDLV